MRLPANHSTRRSTNSWPGCSITLRTCATAPDTSAGSRSGASGTQNTPSGKRSLASAAACKASRVLPVPPGPGQRQQTHIGLLEQANHIGQLALPPQEGSRRHR